MKTKDRKICRNCALADWQRARLLANISLVWCPVQSANMSELQSCDAFQKRYEAGE